MKNYLFIVAFIISCFPIFSQETGEENDLLFTAEKHLYSDPEQSIRIAEQILKTSQTDEVTINAHFILSKGYFVKGDYKEAVEQFFQLKKITENQSSNDDYLEVNLHGKALFNTLGLYELTAKLDTEIQTFLKSSNSNYKELYDVSTQTHTADSLIKTGNYEKAIDVLKQIKEPFHYEIINHTMPFKLFGDAYTGLNQIEISREYYEKALKKLRSNVGYNYQEMQVLIAYSTTFFMDSNHQKAIDTLTKALELNTTFHNNYYLNKTYEQLSQNHLALENEVAFQEFILKTKMASNELTTDENNALNTIFNLLQAQNQEQKTHLKEKLSQIKWYVALGFIILISIGFLTNWFIKTNLRHTQDIVNYEKLIQEFDKKEWNDRSEKKEFIKSLHIPQETETQILQKLEKFERGNKFTHNDMSLSQMASQFETNTKYLSEIINKHKGKNFNLYINELRIKYIVKKLKTEPNYLEYKVSYLAEESGFSSHSSFATIFKNITGISPNVFIELLKKDQKSKKTKTYET